MDCVGHDPALRAGSRRDRRSTDLGLWYRRDRLGHDLRYAIDSGFAQRELDWKPLRSFKESLDETIQWYSDNPSWWQPLLERAGRY